MFWLIPFLAFAGFLYLGVQVIRYRLPRPPGTLSADKCRQRIDRWAKAQRQGFWLHSSLHGLPVVLTVCVLVPCTKAYLKTGDLSFSLVHLQYLTIGIPLGLVGGMLDWFQLRATAREAEAALQRN